MGGDPGGTRPSRAGAAAVALVLVAAGMLFAASAGTASGTDLRSEGPDLRGLIAAESERLDERSATVAELQAEVLDLTGEVDDDAVQRLETTAAEIAPAAHMAPVTGPGLTITLDDADLDRPVPDGAQPDDLVVHQQDLQGIVNALWQGGAEAMTLMDQRVISTSAVRCVGSTLRLQGRVYSPPYVIRVVGDVDAMQQALDDDPTVDLYRDYARVFGLVYQVEEEPELGLPAFEGSIELQHARVLDRSGA